MCLFNSGLNWNTLPVYNLSGLWDHVSRVHHASIHAQQSSTGKTHTHMHIITSKSLYRTDMTQLILTQPSHSLPPGQTPRMSCTLFTCCWFSLLIFSGVFVVGTACGRPSLQRNIWNGSKVYRVAAVNPVEIKQLFFHEAQAATTSGRPLSESLFLLHVVIKEFLSRFLFRFIIVKFSRWFYMHWRMNQSRVWFLVISILLITIQ